MHTHRLRPQTVSQKVTSPIAAKLICVFLIAGSMFRSISSQTRTVNSTQRHYKKFPFTRSPMMHINMVTTLYQSIFFVMVNAKVLFKAGFAEIVSVIILNLNFLSRKTWKTPFCLQRDFTNLTNQGHHYKSFQGHQISLFEFIQRMNSIMQSMNYFNLRLVSEYEQL